MSSVPVGPDGAGVTTLVPLASDCLELQAVGANLCFEVGDSTSEFTVLKPIGMESLTDIDLSGCSLTQLDNTKVTEVTADWLLVLSGPSTAGQGEVNPSNAEKHSERKGPTVKNIPRYRCLQRALRGAVDKSVQK